MTIPLRRARRNERVSRRGLSAPAARRRRRITPIWIGSLSLVLGCILLAIFGPMIAGSPLAQSPDVLTPPSAAHWLGTDELGRDIFSRITSGARVSLLVGFASVTLGLIIALPLGISAGLVGGGWYDEVIMRIFEAVQAVPLFVLALFVIGVTGNEPIVIGPISLSPTAKVIVLLAIAAMPFFARIARAATLDEAQEDYIVSLKLLGVPRRTIIFGELLPNVLPPVVVQSCLWMAIAIFAESALGFLGLGVPPPAPTLGATIADSMGYFMSGSWWYVLFPGVLLLIATLGFNLLGDALNETLSKRSS